MAGNHRHRRNAKDSHPRSQPLVQGRTKTSVQSELDTKDLARSGASNGKAALKDRLETPLKLATLGIALLGAGLGISNSIEQNAVRAEERRHSFVMAESKLCKASDLLSGDSLVDTNVSHHVPSAGDVSAAAELIRVVQADCPQLDFRCRMLQAYALMVSGRGMLALQEVDSAIALYPDSPLAYYKRSGILASLGREAEALAALDRTIELEPKYAFAHTARGLVLRKLGQKDEALAAHDRAIAIDASCVIAHTNRGIVLCDLGRKDEALAACDRAIELDPKLALARYNRGLVLRAIGREQEAVAAFKLAHELEPSLH